jgi:hypothetical protein
MIKDVISQIAIFTSGSNQQLSTNASTCMQHAWPTSKSICGYLNSLRKKTGSRIVDRSARAPALVYRGAVMWGEKLVRFGGGEYRDAIADR